VETLSRDLLMSNLNIQDAQRITRRALEAYEKYLAIKKERSLIEKRARELKKAQGKEEEVFSQLFEESDTRRLPGGKMLVRVKHTVDPVVCTPEMVGQTVVKGYSYYTYEEVAG